MEDDSTQKATQEVLDPRRIGRNSSGLNQKDISDVLAILHPASPAAIQAVQLAAEHRPQHVFSRTTHGTFADNFDDIDEQETIILNGPDAPFHSASRAGDDLALRMSSDLLNPQLGFVFGRNAQFSDIVLPQDSGRRISNQHFRIFLNADAILMVEDLSTNGTLVDEVLLKCRDPRFNKIRMIQPGSIICIRNSNDNDMIKFIVTIPPRLSHLERYEERVREFLARGAPDDVQLQAVQRLTKRQYKTTMKWDGGDLYSIVGQLGKGAFATVYQIATRMEGKLLAAKELEKRRYIKNGQLDKRLDNEMKIMENLRHPNIVEFIQYVDQGDYMYIIMEYVRCGDLQHYLNRNGPLKESQARLMARQILSALNYLHRASITHRDIKPDNILIAEEEPFTVKLSDFGLSKVVQHEETFLKTFCGTLLYCAPEVFPFYDKKRGTKRARGSKQNFHSYSSSVDIWSFAGVLWFSLCGSPPFEGIADATGQAMFNNIMNTQIDTAPLRRAAISDECIDLLCKMLQTDPALRPTDVQCLNHPWLRDGAAILQDPFLDSIVEEEEEDEVAEHELSQLSINEGAGESDEADGVLQDEEFGRLLDHRASKRIRTDRLFPRNQLRDEDDVSSADVSFQGGPAFSAANVADESFQVFKTPDRPRLFGEIRQSALDSSGILNALADEALSPNGSSGRILPDNALPQNVTPDAQRANGLQDTPKAAGHHTQFAGSFSSPSLLGAESLVRELNMESPQSPGSGVHTPNEPATPKTPEMPQHSSLRNPNQHSQFSDATPKAKPPTLNRQISLPKTASFYYDPYDPSTHNLEYASKVSGYDFVGAAERAKTSGPKLPDTVRMSAGSETDARSETSKSETSEGSIANRAVPSLSVELGIKPPPRRLGKLTTTPDSFLPHFTLNIDRARTSWGRHPEATVVYPDSHDTRVPKMAFVVVFYRKNADNPTVQELSQRGEDWTTAEDLQAAIFTAATSGISVNGKHLRKNDDKGRPLYGHLHTGDVIQVYHAAKGSECLRFTCEFYHSAAKTRRPPGQSFQILSGSKNVL